MIYTLLFWLMMQFLALLALPLAARLFRWLPDHGYSFSKALGLLAVSYSLWLGASTHVLYNNLGGILLSVFILAALSAWLLYRDQQVQRDLLNLFIRQRKLALTVELLFTACFLLWVVLRAYAPYKIMSSGGEKFMEIAFLNSILNSPSFPPPDPWLSGFAISYYYFGYVMMAVLTRLSAAPAAIGFELYDALLFALTAQGAFGVVYNLVAISRQPSTPDSQTGLPSIQKNHLTAGLLGALFVAGIGNLQGFLESIYTAGVLPRQFWEWLAIPAMLEKPVTGSWIPNNFMWWWTASRVVQDLDINHQPLTVPITEFPFFSFLLGDNHPHVLGLPFVLMATGLALNLYLRQRAQPDPALPAAASAWARFLNAIGLSGDGSLFIWTALILGGLGFLNTWDMPIYLALVVLAWSLGEVSRRQQLDWALLQNALLLGGILLIAAIVPYTFFYLSFSSQAGGVLPYIFPPTRLPQYLVMFGVQVFFTIAFLLTQLGRGGQATWRTALRMWGYVFLACLLLLTLILAAAGLAAFGQTGAGTLSTALQGALGERTLAQAVQTILLARINNPWLFLLLTALLGLTLGNVFLALQPSPVQDSTSGDQATDDQAASSPAFHFQGDPAPLFANLLIFTGLALTFIVEFIYLRDGFGVRLNTVFKFYYQGWVMLSCAAAYALWWLFGQARSYNVRPVFSRAVALSLRIAAGLLIAASLVYPLLSFYSRVDGFHSAPDLDGSSMLAHSNPDDFAAIHWLQLNAIPQSGEVPTILEAPAPPYASYVYEGRISAFTGLPTLLGWPGHENQWRGSYIEPAKRQPEIQTIFGTHDGQEMLNLLHKWGVSYVIIGVTEQRYVVGLCQSTEMVCEPTTALRKFDLFLKPVFESGQTRIYQVP